MNFWDMPIYDHMSCLLFYNWLETANACSKRILPCASWGRWVKSSFFHLLYLEMPSFLWYSHVKAVFYIRFWKWIDDTIILKATPKTKPLQHLKEQIQIHISWSWPRKVLYQHHIYPFSRRRWLHLHIERGSLVF